jgi:hypothetical protein
MISPEAQNILKEWKEHEKARQSLNSPVADTTTTSTTTTTNPPKKEVPWYWNPETQQSVPPPSQADQVLQTAKNNDTSVVYRFVKGIKDYVNGIYTRDIRPLKYLTKKDIIETIKEQRDKITAHPDLIFRSLGAGLYGGYSEAVRTLSFGFINPPKQLWKPKYEEEEEASKVSAFVSNFPTYAYQIGSLEKLAEAGTVKLALKYPQIGKVLSRIPRPLLKKVIDTAVFFGRSQIDKDLFYLTPEEQKAGVTIASKRFNRLLTTAFFWAVGEGLDKILQKVGLVKPVPSQLTLSDSINNEVFNEVKSKLQKSGLDKYLNTWSSVFGDNNFVYNIGINDKPLVQIVYPADSNSLNKWNVLIGVKESIPKLTAGTTPSSGISVSVDEILPPLNPNLPQDVITRAVATNALMDNITKLPPEDIPAKNLMDAVSDAVIQEASKTDKVLDVIKAEYLLNVKTEREMGYEPLPNSPVEEIFHNYLRKKYPRKFFSLYAIEPDINGIINSLGDIYDEIEKEPNKSIQELVVKHLTSVGKELIPDIEKYKQTKRIQQELDAIISNYTFDGQKFETPAQFINYLSHNTDKLYSISVEYSPSEEVKQDLAKYREQFKKTVQKAGYKSPEHMLISWEKEFLDTAEKDPLMLVSRDLQENPERSDLTQLMFSQHNENAIKIAQGIEEQLKALPAPKSVEVNLSSGGSGSLGSVPPEGPVSPDFSGQIYDENYGWLKEELKKFSDLYYPIKNTIDLFTANPEIMISDPKLRAELFKKGGFGGKLLPYLYKDYNSPRYAHIIVLQHLNNTLGALKKDEEKTFLSVLGNLDLLRESLQGKTVAGNLSKQQIEANLEFLSKQKNDAISDAIRKYMEINRAYRDIYEKELGIKLNVEDIGLTPEEIQYYLNKIQQWTGVGDLDIRDLYFPHLLKKYYENSGPANTPSRITQHIFNPHLISRSETGVPDDIVINRKVLGDYWYTMELYLRHSKIVDNLLRDFDVINKIDANKYPEVVDFLNKYQRSGRILDLSDPEIPQQVKDVIKSVDPNYKKLQYFPLSKIQYMFPVETVNETDVLQIIKEILPDVLTDPQKEVSAEQIQQLYGKYAKEIYTKGRSPMILVPPEIAKALNQWKPKIDPHLRDIVKLEMEFFSKWWKPFVIEAAGLNFQIVNGIGDFMNLMYKDPAAFLYFNKAMKAVNALITGDFSEYENDPFLKHALEVLKEEGVVESTFGGTMFDIWGNKGYWTNPLKVYTEIFSQVGERRELLPKVMDYLVNIERIRKGQLPVVRGDRAFIKNMVDEAIRTKDNELLIKGLAYSSMSTTGDYNIIPPQYKNIVSPVFPFGFWYSQESYKLWRLLFDISLPLLAELGLDILTRIYNNTGERAKYENSLPDYIKQQHHVIVGVGDDNNLHVARLRTPVTDVFYGMFNIPAVVDGLFRMNRQLKTALTEDEKKQIIKDNVLKIASDVISAPEQMVSSLISPIIKIAEGIHFNKDPYNGRPIVPDKYKDDTEVKLQYIGRYILESITNYTRYGEEALREYDPNSQFGQVLISILKHAFDPRQPFIYKTYPDALIQETLNNGHALTEARWNYITDQIEDALSKNDTKALQSYIQSIVNSPEKEFVVKKLTDKFKTTEGKLRFIEMVLQATVPKLKTQEQKDKVKKLINKINIILKNKETSKALEIYDMMHGINPFEALNY